MVEDQKDAPKPANTVSGLPENTAAALCYSVGWVTGLIFFLIEKDNKKIRFHALQSIVVFGLVQGLSLVPVIGWTLSPILTIIGFVLWLVLIFKTYNGENFDLPVISDWVKKQVK